MAQQTTTEQDRTEHHVTPHHATLHYTSHRTTSHRTTSHHVTTQSLGCDDAVTNKADFVNPAALPTCPAGGADEPKKPLVAVCCGTTTRKVDQPAISKLALFRWG